MRHALSYCLISCLAVGVGCATDPLQPDPTQIPVDGAESRITAVLGGSVALADQSVRLVVPPGSLSADATIAIREIAELPKGEMNGMRPIGKAYRFTPAGTQFSLSEAAGMTMKFDRSQMIAQGLDPRTVQLHYFDEAAGRYVAVAGRVDDDHNEVFGRIEHFTIYVPMASALQPGNNAPLLTLQATIPAVARGGAPLAIRATVKDIDGGGAITGVSLIYNRPLYGAGRVAMTRDTTIGALDTYQVVLPASQVIADVGPDLIYRVEATDNLGTVTTSATITLDLLRVANRSTAAAAPATQLMAAGFSRYFTWSMKDDTNTAFTFLPDSVEVSNNLGRITAIGSAGVGFEARTVGAGGLIGRIDNLNAAAQIVVTNGQLASMQLLDQNRMPLNLSGGAVAVKEGSTFTFDAVGQDAFGNRVLVNPSWSCDANLGVISTTGVLDALDGSDIGHVTASLGGVSVSEWVRVYSREFFAYSQIPTPRTHSVASRTGLILSGGMPTIATIDNHGSYAVADYKFGLWNYFEIGEVRQMEYAAFGGTDFLAVTAPSNEGFELTLQRRRSGEIGFSPIQTIATSGSGIFGVSLAVDGTGNPWVSYISNDSGVRRIITTTFNNGTRVTLGATANHDRNLGAESAEIFISPSGDAHIISVEENQTVTGFDAYVKRWNGHDWIEIGPRLQSFSNPARPALAFSASGRPFVASIEEDSTLSIRAYDGTSWATIGQPYAVPGSFIVEPSLSIAMIGEVPYVAFVVTDAAATVQVVLGHLNMAVSPSLMVRPIPGLAAGGRTALTSQGRSLVLGTNVKRDPSLSASVVQVQSFD
jgi:hypothetical protein